MVVLDACAIIAYLRDEDGADEVESALIAGDCIVHALNLYEVYKDCLQRKENRETAEQLLAEVASVGVVARDDMDEPLWKEAATIKTDFRDIAIPDCFALALAARVKAPLLSSDHGELDPVHVSGKYQIRFFR